MLTIALHRQQMRAPDSAVGSASVPISTPTPLAELCERLCCQRRQAAYAAMALWLPAAAALLCISPNGIRYATA